MPDAGAVDRVAGGEVVGAVEDHPGFCNQVLELFAFQAGRDLEDLHLGVEPFQGEQRLIDLAIAHALGAVEDLPLQVGEVDAVRVGERDPADAGRGEIERRRAAQAAGADDERAPRAQPLLSFYPDFGKKDVAAVAEELLVVQLAPRGFGLSLASGSRRWAWCSRPSAAARP